MAKSVLGIAFGPGVIQVAEVSFDVKSATALRAAEFSLAEGDALDKPLELGKKFGAFLKENKFSARQAVAGLPTQWLMLKSKTVPVMSPANLAGMLRLQAERDFSIEMSDLVLDYVGGDVDRSTPNGSRPLLLVAALQSRVEQIRTVLKTAGLVPVALTSSALALAGNAFAGRTVLSVGAFGAEVIVNGCGNLAVPTMLAKSVSSDGAWLAPSIGDAKRTLALVANDPGAAIGLWNGADIPATQIEQLASGLKVEVKRLTSVTGVDTSNVSNPMHFGQALALTRFQKNSEPGALDFFDSKLIEKTAGLFAKFKWWMGVAALLVIGCIVAFAVSWWRDAAELAALNAQAVERKKETKSAKEFVARFASTQGWYEKRTNVLDCLNELKNVIPSDGGAWVTRLAVKDDFRCEMSLKAINDKRYFEVFDAIEKNEAFRDVKLVYMNKQDKKNTDVTFAISFDFKKQ